MPRYSEERRHAVVTKLLRPHNLSPQVIAEQEGISLGTVYTWRKQAAPRDAACRTPIGTVSLNPERELQVTVAEPEKQVA